MNISEAPMQRLVCQECGMCFDCDQQRQHADWHVDQHLKRMQRPVYDDPVANHLLRLLLDALHHAPEQERQP